MVFRAISFDNLILYLCLSFWLHLHAFMCHSQSCLFLASLCLDGPSAVASFRSSQNVLFLLSAYKPLKSLGNTSDICSKNFLIISNHIMSFSSFWDCQLLTKYHYCSVKKQEKRSDFNLIYFTVCKTLSKIRKHLKQLTCDDESIGVLLGPVLIGRWLVGFLSLW